jgi:hypothetical protein
MWGCIGQLLAITFIDPAVRGRQVASKGMHPLVHS